MLPLLVDRVDESEVGGWQVDLCNMLIISAGWCFEERLCHGSSILIADG